MDYDYEISQLKESLALVIQTQRTWEKIQAATAKTARDAREGLEAIEKSHAEMAKVQAEFAESQTKLRSDMDESFRRHELRFERIDLTLAEITDKLNGLIGYVDSQHPKQ